MWDGPRAGPEAMRNATVRLRSSTIMHDQAKTLTNTPPFCAVPAALRCVRTPVPSRTASPGVHLAPTPERAAAPERSGAPSIQLGSRAGVVPREKHGSAGSSRRPHRPSFRLASPGHVGETASSTNPFKRQQASVIYYMVD